MCKAKRSDWGMGRRTKIITECRQAGGDADGDNIVGTGTKYFTVSSSMCTLAESGLTFAD